MALSGLLKNQTIVIDNHGRGNNILTWEKKLHIHKKMNGGSKSSLECRIYFADRNGRIEYSKEKGKDVLKLKSEIEEAFKDSSVRSKFIQSFCKAIRSILKDENKTRSDMSRLARRAVKRIAVAFGLPEDIKDDMVDEASNYYMYETGNCFIGLKLAKKRNGELDNKRLKVYAGNDREIILHLARIK